MTEIQETGIDWVDGTDSKGELIVPIIYLWDQIFLSPESLDAQNLTGALKHDSRVDVHARKEFIVDDEKVVYYYVSTVVHHEGKDYPQKGWVWSWFLRERRNKGNDG